MKIYFAGDHAGFHLKQALIEQLSMSGHEAEDLGPHELDLEDDYPEYVEELTRKITSESSAFGIICAGTGQGEAMCANRQKGVRAAVFYGKIPAVASLDAEGGRSKDGFDIVRLARRHNNANILAIGARFVSPADALQAVHLFLETSFDVESPRHARRLAKF